MLIAKTPRGEVIQQVPKKKFWQIRAEANESNSADILLYGPISSETWWGDEVTPKQFKQDLDSLGDVSTINVFINSMGGDTFAAQAILSMLKRHSARIDVYIDGIAASAASIIAMAGDTIYMPSNAMMMVHNAWTIAIGNAADFRKLADDLEKITESIIAAYEEKTGLESGKIQELLDAETWLTAADAVSLGFADEIEQEKLVAASISGGVLMINNLAADVSSFKNFPQDKFKSAGRTISTANEQKLVDARDKLNEVLEQVSDDVDSSNRIEPQTLAPIEEPQDTQILAYMEKQIALKKRKY